MFPEIPEDVIRNVREANDIVDVVEEYVQLKKQGRSYKGLCPFHEEKTPSFSVTKEKQIFHCFGCGKGGNVITFLMEIESFSFIEAVQHLANRAGISLPETTVRKSSLSKEANQILEAFDWLTKYYHHLLKYSDEGKKGLEYFVDRGLTEETINRFQLGFSPYNSKFTINFLEKKGFHEQFLIKYGFLSPRENSSPVDVFRGRVIFPIKNHLGKVVAFGGRAVQGEEPKYLNSIEHDLFQKGNLLFNFFEAKNHIRKQNEVIIFEGYMDVISAFQAGIKNVVATLGTSLTTNQAKLLNRYVDTVILCYDADEAGEQASFHAANLLQKIGCDVKIAQVKDGMDPDEYILKFGGEQFKEQVIATSDTYFKFFMKYKRKEFNLSIDSEKIAYIETIVEKLSEIESPIEREYYIKDIASEFQLSSDIIHHDVEKHRKRNQKLMDKSSHNSNTITKMTNHHRSEVLPAYYNAERLLLAHMFKHDHLIEKVQHKLQGRFNVEEHQVIVTHLYALYEESNEIHLSELIDKLADPNLKKIVTEIAMTPINEDISDQEINDYIEIIEREANDYTYLRKLKEKQKNEKNPILAAKIGLEIIELEKQLKNI